MNDLMKTEFFGLMNENSQKITNEEMQIAYEGFMEQVRIISQSENSLSETFRMLNITRVELVGIESLYRYGQGEKCPKISLS